MAARCEETLATAFRGLFGDQKKLPTDAKLEAIFKNAWDFNCYIKSKVAHLGDFETEWFPYGEKYDNLHMQVLDGKPGDPSPNHIFLTCGLGLKVTNAIGENRDPESEVVERAMIISPEMYK